MLLRYLIAELLKLRRSLALLLCIAAPGFVIVLNTFVWLRSDDPGYITDFAFGAASLWGFAMMPLTVTALSVLLAQMEHVPRGWLHLLALPGARPHLYLAKALAMMALVAAMSVLLWLGILAGSAIVLALRDNVAGEIYLLPIARLLAQMAAAATLAAMLQLWVALSFRSFVPPLVLGIGGTFVAFAMSRADEAIYFPWLMPGKIMSEAQDHRTALLLGSLGGLAALVAMVAHLSRREA